MVVRSTELGPTNSFFKPKLKLVFKLCMDFPAAIRESLMYKPVVATNGYSIFADVDKKLNNRSAAAPPPAAEGLAKYAKDAHKKCKFNRKRSSLRNAPNLRHPLKPTGRKANH